MTFNKSFELARQEQLAQLSVELGRNARWIESASILLPALADNVCNTTISFVWPQSGRLRSGNVASRANVHWQRLVHGIDAWHIRQLRISSRGKRSYYYYHDDDYCYYYYYYFLLLLSTIAYYY